MTRNEGGFSLLELLIAAAVMSVCAGALLSLVIAGERLGRLQPAVADQQQRGRMALQVLSAELSTAGAGMNRGAHAGPLAQFFAPIAPSADGGLTIWYAGSRGGQAALAASLASSDVEVAVDAMGFCPAALSTCAFTPGSSALIFDRSGCHDVVRIDAVDPLAMTVRSGARGCAYAAGSPIAEGEVRTYRVDPATRQLLRRDEATGTSLPVMDDVASMSIEWLDGARHVRVTVRLVTTLFQLPDLVASLDAMPANLQERW